jgi:hypothetical protein
LISQVVIYLRHNPCYLHAYEEPIHNKLEGELADTADEDEAEMIEGSQGVGPS